MKSIICIMLILVVCQDINSQTDTLRRKTRELSTQVKTLNTTQKGVLLQQQSEKGIQNLPDLKLTSFNVTYVGSQVVDGTTKHTVEITYTVKNEGTVSISANSVGVQGWIGYDPAWPKIIPCGGKAVSTIGEVLAPGGTLSGTLRGTAAFDKNGHPIYTLYVDDSNTVKELNEQNNTAQMTILF